MFASLSRCPRLTSLHLEGTDARTELVDGLALLPLLQRLQLRYGFLQEPATNAWTALRSLREIEFDYVRDGPLVVSVLRSIPTLQLLRWRCRIPEFIVYSYLPTMVTLRDLMTAAPQLRVELVMPRTFDEWQAQRLRPHASAVDEGMLPYQRRRWDELQQLVTELPRVSVAIPNPKDELDYK
jgi:hypothetical protein